jgi:NADPH:quinone reductase-like Zn-dependent oxidoreductase
LRRERDLGLDTGVNYRQTTDWAKWVLEQTGGVGADLIVEVGGAGTFAQSLKAVRVGGAIAQIGILSQSSEPLSIGSILHKQVHLRGIYVGSRAHFSEMNRAIALHSLRPSIDRVFAFDHVLHAVRTLASGSHFGKLVICV